MKKLSIVIPCYNEEKNIKYLYDEIIEAFKEKKYTLELVFINDGSKDNTLLELKKLIKLKTCQIKIIDFSRNFGKEAGIYAGLQNASGDYITLLDGDMQQPPKLILPMLDILEKDENVDIVAYFQEKRIENKAISCLKQQFYKLFSKLCGVNFVNGASDFRLFRKKVKDAILALNEHNRFSKGIFAWIGFNTYYLPYTPDKRKYGESKWNIKSLFKYATSGILSFTKNPFSLFLKTGILTVMAAFIWFLILLICHSVSNWQYICSFMLLLFGFNLLIMYYLSIFINRTYTETINRPMYIVKDIITNEK